MRVLGAAELLSLWERGMSRHALDRAALLAAEASRPKTPTALRTMPAPASSVSAASESVPPTTGSAVERTLLAAFAANSSVLPVTMPVRPR